MVDQQKRGELDDVFAIHGAAYGGKAGMPPQENQDPNRNDENFQKSRN